MVRYLENGEKKNIRDLYEHCFEDSQEYTDYYFEKRIKDNIVAVNENKDGDIMSAMHLIPKNAMIGTLKTPIMYIYAVGTYTKYRNEGYMKEMFSVVLKDMFADMEAFTYLIPSDEKNASIYRKLGFEYVMDQVNMRPADNRKKATHSLILRKAENSDLVRLSIFAQSSMEKEYSVALTKSMDYFRKIKELIDVEGGQIDIYVENKVVVGYRIWIDDEIFEEVLDKSIAAMSWLGTEKKPYVMARILNMRKTLRFLNFKSFREKVIRVTDPVIEENNGCYHLIYRDGNVQLDKIDESQSTIVPEIEVTIGELTAHVFGYKLIDGLPEVCRKGSFMINDYV